MNYLFFPLRDKAGDREQGEKQGIHNQQGNRGKQGDRKGVLHVKHLSCPPVSPPVSLFRDDCF